MEKSSEIANRLYEEYRDLITRDLSDTQVQIVESAFVPWIQAALEQYDPDLYSEEEFVKSVIPDEISYEFQGLNAEKRFEKAVTAYDRLRVQILNNETYERARMFVHEQGDPALQKALSEADLKELKDIEKRLSGEYPSIYQQLKRQISESKLDCMFVIRDGGASSLRLGREIQRLKQD